MNAETTTESRALAAPRNMGFDLSPQNFEQAIKFSEMLANSDLVPKDFKGKPGNCLIAMQWGAELGLKPLQAIQNIAPINGRPTLWGDAMLALVRSSPLCEYVTEGWQPDGTAFCKAKRRGEPEQERTFSDADAKLAGLLGKQGPWSTGPKRMKQLRARAFALRDVFTDVLRGMAMAEEVQDTPTETHMGPVEVVKPTEPTPFEHARFVKNLPAWRTAIANKKTTADAVIAKANTLGKLTQEQIDAIRAPMDSPVTDVQPKGEGMPAVTFAMVNDALLRALDQDALNEAADLIGEVTDPEFRIELNGVFDRRLSELTA